eukprot:7377178-Prymnesium_polylepis.1
MAQLDEDLAYFRRAEPLPRELMWEIDRARAPRPSHQHSPIPIRSIADSFLAAPSSSYLPDHCQPPADRFCGRERILSFDPLSCAGVHMRNRLPIFASTRLSKDDSEGEFGFGGVDEVIPLPSHLGACTQLYLV